MDTPLYKLYLFKRTPVYYSASAQRLAELRDNIRAQQRDLGIRNLFNAEMAWSNEKFEFFGVEFYPSLQAVQDYAGCLSELGFFQYVQGESYLGIPMDGNYPDFNPDFLPPAAEAAQENVFRVYLAREAPTAHLIPEDTRAEIFERVQEAAQSAGALPLLAGYMRWNYEGYEYFGVERFPNMEALITFSQFLTEIGWYRMTDSVSYLGSAIGGLGAGL